MKYTKEKAKTYNCQKEKGITLIALIITIIVMIILVAVSVSVALQGGLFDKARNAAKQTEEKAIYEEIVSTMKIENNGNIDATTTGNEAEEMLIAEEKEATFDETTGILTVTGKHGTYYYTITNKEIKIGKEGGGTPPQEQEEIEAPETKNYIGCYADIDGNGTIDGIIYADLAQSKSGTWNDNSRSSYAYTKKDNLKKYCISEQDHTQTWGTGTRSITADVIAPSKEDLNGEVDRFYVMALSDFEKNGKDLFYWYYTANSLDNIVGGEKNDFGDGKQNTIDMVAAWNGGGYGTKTDSTSGMDYVDLWGAIQDGQYNLVQNATDSKKWFIPSKAEWSAFGDYLYSNLEVTADATSHTALGLGDFYWSATQCFSTGAYYLYFNYGCFDLTNVYYTNFVRLSATF